MGIGALSFGVAMNFHGYQQLFCLMSSLKYNKPIGDAKAKLARYHFEGFVSNPQFCALHPAMNLNCKVEQGWMVTSLLLWAGYI